MTPAAKGDEPVPGCILAREVGHAVQIPRSSVGKSQLEPKKWL